MNLIKKDTEMLKVPVHEMQKEKKWLLAMKDRLAKQIAEQEQKNKELREVVNMPEDKKASVSTRVNTLRDQMGEMREKMLLLEKNMIDIGRNPGKAIERISNPILLSLKDQVE